LDASTTHDEFSQQLINHVTPPLPTYGNLVNKSAHDVILEYATANYDQKIYLFIFLDKNDTRVSIICDLVRVEICREGTAAAVADGGGRGFLGRHFHDNLSRSETGKAYDLGEGGPQGEGILQPAVGSG
jgi:hypothetical protein